MLLNYESNRNGMLEVTLLEMERMLKYCTYPLTSAAYHRFSAFQEVPLVVDSQQIHDLMLQYRRNKI
jgi:hypothetical protein